MGSACCASKESSVDGGDCGGMPAPPVAARRLQRIVRPRFRPKLPSIPEEGESEEEDPEESGDHQPLIRMRSANARLRAGKGTSVLPEGPPLTARRTSSPWFRPHHLQCIPEGESEDPEWFLRRLLRAVHANAAKRVRQYQVLRGAKAAQLSFMAGDYEEGAAMADYLKNRLTRLASQFHQGDAPSPPSKVSAAQRVLQFFTCGCSNRMSPFLKCPMFNETTLRDPEFVFQYRPQLFFGEDKFSLGLGGHRFSFKDIFRHGHSSWLIEQDVLL